MAKILCTEKEYDKLKEIFNDNSSLFSALNIEFEIVDLLQKIPKFYKYVCETEDFYVYRHKYTGNEIHIVKEPETFILKSDIGV